MTLAQGYTTWPREQPRSWGWLTYVAICCCQVSTRLPGVSSSVGWFWLNLCSSLFCVFVKLAGVCPWKLSWALFASATRRAFLKKSWSAGKSQNQGWTKTSTGRCTRKCHLLPERATLNATKGHKIYGWADDQVVQAWVQSCPIQTLEATLWTPPLHHEEGRAAEWLIALEFQTARLLFSLTVSFGLEDWSAMSLQCHETWFSLLCCIMLHMNWCVSLYHGIFCPFGAYTFLWKLRVGVVEEPFFKLCGWGQKLLPLHQRGEYTAPLVKFNFAAKSLVVFELLWTWEVTTYGCLCWVE